MRQVELFVDEIAGFQRFIVLNGALSAVFRVKLYRNIAL